MSTGNGHPNRELLEQRANIARERVVDTLNALDVRRHHATDVKYQVQHHLRPLIMIGAGVLLVLASGITASIVGARKRQAHPWRARWIAAKRIWQNPERVATRARERPYPLQLFQKLGMTAATFALGQVLHRAIEMRTAPPAHT